MTSIRPVGYLDEVVKKLDESINEERYFYTGNDNVIKEELVPINNLSCEQIVGKSYDGRPIMGYPQAVVYEVIESDTEYLGQRGNFMTIRLLKIKD